MILKRFEQTTVNKIAAKRKKKILPPETNLFDGLISLNLGDNWTL